MIRHESAVRRTLPLAAALLFLSAASSRAQERGEGLASMTNPGDGARYALTLVPAVHDAPSMVRQEAGGSKIVLQDGSDTWTVNGRASELELSRSPVVAGTGLVVPAKLWNLQGGGTFFRKNGERKNWGVQLGLGSASNLPFHSLRETEVRATAHREFPSRARDSWMLFLAYSNNRSFANNIPFPGAAYVFREPLPGLEATIGLPFMSASYKPNEDWRASFSLFGPTNVSLQGDRRLVSETWAYARWERNPSQWLRADRAQRTDRLVYDQQEVRAGVRTKFENGFSVDASLGRDFNRRFYESRDANRSSVPKAELADAWSLALRLSWRR
ncbi:MAG: hypothetical protein WC969_01035 [Elusimicrobiota bacterium]